MAETLVLPPTLVHPTRSPAEMLATMPGAVRREALLGFDATAVVALLRDWRFWARPKQVAPPGIWDTWLVLAGRGYGKTRIGGEWTRAKSEVVPRLHLIGPTAGDVRDTMLLGESGLITCAPRHRRPQYIASKRLVRFPSGAIALCFSAEEPERLRGPQCYALWADEIAAWQYQQDAWDMAMFGLRLGDHPQACVTTTPKPTPLIKGLVARGVNDDALRAGEPAALAKTHEVVITSGSSYENRANLAASYYSRVIKPYEGTRLGRQEIYAALLTDTPGALWTNALLEELRVKKLPSAIVRMAVAVDPAVTVGEDSNETGIILGCKCANGHAYVLYDGSGHLTAAQWGRRAVFLYEEAKADRVVGEVNNGGDLVEANLRAYAPHVSYKAVTASRGKTKRAEPVAALYEQGLVHHVGYFTALESQMTTWTHEQLDYSPDRMDALVWVLTELMLTKRGVFVA